MYVDFHYYMIKALACEAGFADEEAECIAFASQYIDDSLEYRKMTISGLERLPAGLANELRAKALINGSTFDPVCTAHDGFTMVGGALPKAQLNTYMPFHFVPQNPGQNQFTTKPDCEIAGKVVNVAVNELKAATGTQGGDSNNRYRKLIKLGIALHTYADTWAHQDFSAFYSDTDNGVGHIELCNKVVRNSADKIDQENSSWIPYTPNFGPSAVPATGHAKASYLPDASHQVWRYTNSETGELIVRDNPTEYLLAAKSIFLKLCEAKAKAKDQDSLAKWEHVVEKKAKDCIEFDPKEELTKLHGVLDKIYNYKKIFGSVEFSYHAKDWDGKGVKTEDNERIVWANTVWPDAALVPIFFRAPLAPREETNFSDSRLNLKKVDVISLYNPINSPAYGVEYKTKNLDDPKSLFWFYFQLEAHCQREMVKAEAKIDESKLKSYMGSQLGDLARNIGANVLKEYNIGESVLKNKDHWISVTVFNRTPYKITYDKNNKELDGTHGKYWVAPSDIDNNGKVYFAACENANAQTGVGGVALFTIHIDEHRKIPLGIAFSNPKYSGFVDAIGGSVTSATGDTAKALTGYIGSTIAILNEDAGKSVKDAGDRFKNELTSLRNKLCHDNKCGASFNGDKNAIWQGVERYVSNSEDAAQISQDAALVVQSKPGNPGNEATVTVSIEQRTATMPKVLFATYGTDERGRVVTDHVQEMANFWRSVIRVADERLGGDPHFGVQKKFSVMYRDRKGHIKTRCSPQGTDVVLNDD